MVLMETNLTLDIFGTNVMKFETLSY